MADRPLPRIEGERPPPGFSYLPTDVFQFRCHNAGCDKIQKQNTPVREFYNSRQNGKIKGAKPGAALVYWWWCNACRTRLRQSKKTVSNTGKKLALAARNTPTIQWARKTEPPAV